jgi:hypothetical protein
MDKVLPKKCFASAVPDQVGSAPSLRGARKGDEAIQKAEFSALDCFASLAMTVQVDWNML